MKGQSRPGQFNMAEEEQGFYIITKLGEILITIAVAMIFVIIAQAFIIREIDVSSVEPGLLAYNLVYSKDILADAKNPLFPSIDSRKLSDGNLEKSIPVKGYIGAELMIKTSDKEFKAYYNKAFYERWLQAASAKARGCAVVDRRSMPVLIDGELARAEITVVSEREIAKCS